MDWLLWRFDFIAECQEKVNGLQLHIDQATNYKMENHDQPERHVKRTRLEKANQNYLDNFT